MQITRQSRAIKPISAQEFRRRAVPQLLAVSLLGALFCGVLLFLKEEGHIDLFFLWATLGLIGSIFGKTQYRQLSDLCVGRLFDIRGHSRHPMGQKLWMFGCGLCPLFLPLVFLILSYAESAQGHRRFVVAQVGLCTAAIVVSSILPVGAFLKAHRDVNPENQQKNYYAHKYPLSLTYLTRPMVSIVSGLALDTQFFRDNASRGLTPAEVADIETGSPTVVSVLYQVTRASEIARKWKNQDIDEAEKSLLYEKMILEESVLSGYPSKLKKYSWVQFLDPAMIFEIILSEVIEEVVALQVVARSEANIAKYVRKRQQDDAPHDWAPAFVKAFRESPGGRRGEALRSSWVGSLFVEVHPVYRKLSSESTN